MGIDTNIADYDWNAALAALAWQAELGVTEVMVEAAIDRYALPERQEPVLAKAKPAAPVVMEVAKPDPVQAATLSANACADLAALRAALAAFEHCELKKGARDLVFCDGNPQASLMVIGDAPGREDVVAGKPFMGAAGQLLDKMLAAIGLARGNTDSATSAYLTNVLPWRPPVDRDATEEEIAMLQPFLARHIALAKPRVVIAMGNTVCSALLGQVGVARLRGTWAKAEGVPVMPITHPADLLRNPAAKREAWADLLAVKARLTE